MHVQATTGISICGSGFGPGRCARPPLIPGPSSPVVISQYGMSPPQRSKRQPNSAV
ncbi:MAG TPA: hypothetical protein VF699_08440 [Caulobacteraceae bacterium]